MKKRILAMLLSVVMLASTVELTSLLTGTNILAGTEAPAVCPTCNHPQSYFEIHAENY